MVFDYAEESEGWGKKALWLLLGVSVPVVVWLLTRGKDDSTSKEPRRESEAVEKAPESAVEETPEVVGTAPEPAAEEAPEVVEKAPEPAVEEAPEVVETAPEPAAEEAPEIVEKAPEPAAEVPEVEPTHDGQAEWSVTIQVEDGEKVSHSAELLSLDPAAKKAEVRSQTEFVTKDKVRLKIPCEDGGAAFTLAATVQQVQDGRATLKLFAINAALKERVEKFVAAQPPVG